MEVDKFVKESLQRLGLENYVENFIEHEIDRDTFVNLTKEEIQVLIPGKLGPQKKLMVEVQRLRELAKGPAVKTIPVNDTPPQKTVHTSLQQPLNNANPEPEVPVVRRVSRSSAKVEGDTQNSDTVRAAKVSFNRGTSVLELKETETGKPHPKTPPSNINNEQPSTLAKVIAVGAPITVTILAGTAKRHIIKNYTAPALDDLADLDDGTPQFAPSSNVHSNAEIQISGRSAFRADGSDGLDTPNLVASNNSEDPLGLESSTQDVPTGGGLNDTNSKYLDTDVNEVGGSKDCVEETAVDDEFLDTDDFYCVDPSELELFDDSQVTVVEDMVETITNALYAFFE